MSLLKIKSDAKVTKISDALSLDMTTLIKDVTIYLSKSNKKINIIIHR